MMLRHTRLVVWTVLAVGWTTVGTQAQQIPADVSQPLSYEASAVAQAVPDEGTDRPEQHYYRSNEWRQDLLIPHLEGLGGALVGVGSDQNYTMAAMAQSQVLFLVDYDPLIPWIHKIYAVLIAESETPEDLVSRFSEERAAETKALLTARLSDHPRGERIVRHFERRREAWHAYLVRVAGLVRDGRPFSWLASREMYDYVRALHRNGRVISRNGDVTAERTLRAVGDAARRLGVPVRLVYFSNAEQFFPYTDSFIENMRALPTDERSVALRTIRHRNIPIAEDGRWHYLVHDFSDFLARLSTGAYRRSFAFTSDLLAAGRPFLGSGGISTLNAEAPQSMVRRVRQRRAERRRTR